jgi:hypothetical protein
MRFLQTRWFMSGCCCDLVIISVGQPLSMTISPNIQTFVY